jgi:hypothetical protein
VVGFTRVDPIRGPTTVERIWIVNPSGYPFCELIIAESVTSGWAYSFMVESLKCHKRLYGEHVQFLVAFCVRNIELRHNLVIIANMTTPQMDGASVPVDEN